jgi:hypothetical protein
MWPDDDNGDMAKRFPPACNIEVGYIAPRYSWGAVSEKFLTFCARRKRMQCALKLRSRASLGSA